MVFHDKDIESLDSAIGCETFSFEEERSVVPKISHNRFAEFCSEGDIDYEKKRLVILSKTRRLV